MNDKIALLVIDPQNDFCDIPDSELAVAPASLAAGRPQPAARPALPVAGADRDMKRLAAFIDRVGPELDAIHVTLDSHHSVDIAHAAWWTNDRGDAPAPFTVITAADLADGTWRARDGANQAHSLRYVEALEHAGRYRLVIWPEHCLIGSWGHNVHGAVKHSLDEWARRRMQQVRYVFKGMNPKTEHYSAVEAEVPDAGDPATQRNAALLKALAEADQVVIAGEALSHCVANTVRDIARNFGAGGVRKLVLLTDCASSVGGFEQLGADFLAELTGQGMKTAGSTEFLA